MSTFADLGKQFSGFPVASKSSAVQVIKNGMIAASIAKDHFVDDPVVLTVAALRALPGPFGTVPARVLRLMGRASTVAGAVGAALSGDAQALASLISKARRRANARELARLTDVALAAHQLPLAKEAFDAIPHRARSQRTVLAVAARLAAYEGDLDEAAALARRLNPKSALARRYEGRLRLMSGSPVTARVPRNYRPVPDHVLHVLTTSLPHTASGYAQRTHSILLALRETGWNVLGVTRIGYPIMTGKLLADASDEVDGVTYHRILPWPMQGDEHGARAQQAAEMVKLVEDFRPALIHTTTPFHNSVPVAAIAKAYGIPWVYEVRGQQADTWVARHGGDSEGSQYHRLYQEREIQAAMDADAVVTLGDSMRDTLVDAGVPASKITLCPNAIGEAYLDDPPTKQEARAALELDPELQYIGAVSSLVGYEGHDDLLDAMALLSKEFPKLRLLLVGDGISRPALLGQAERLGIAHLCTIPGRVPRETARLWHASLDVFVVPRKDLEVTRKVTPLKPVEASAVARPVVASDLPALRELVTDGINGLLSEPENPEALAATIRRLLTDHELAERLGENGRQWVLEDRTWQANARRYDAVYRQLLDGDTSDA